MDMGVTPKIGGNPQNGWFTRENLIRIDDLGVPLFLETPISYKIPMSFFASFLAKFPIEATEKSPREISKKKTWHILGDRLIP